MPISCLSGHLSLDILWITDAINICLIQYFEAHSTERQPQNTELRNPENLHPCRYIVIYVYT